MRKKKIVIAYTGDLKSSLAIQNLVGEGYDVVAVCIDIGGNQDFTEIRTRAIQVGAVTSYIIDATKEFAEQYVLLVLRAQAFCEKKYPFVSSITRPLIAKKLVEVAEVEKADAIAETDDDAKQFVQLISTLKPSLKTVAPFYEKNWTHKEQLEYVNEMKMPILMDLDNPYLETDNLWGRTVECETLGNCYETIKKEMYALTVAVEDAPNKPDLISVDFEKGIPIALNGEKMSLSRVLAHLNFVAGKHGIGRIDVVDNYLVGSKSQKVYECPGAITLLKAYEAIEEEVIEDDAAQFKTIISQKIIELIEDGLWFSSLRDGLEAFIKETQQTVDGTVILKLLKGQVTVEKNNLANQELITDSVVNEIEELAVVALNHS